MKFLIMCASIALGFLAFFTTSQLSADKFNFREASTEERQEWLDKQASVFKKTARFFLPSGRGPSALNFYLDDVKTRPRRRELELMIRVKVPYGKSVYSVPEKDILPRFCKKYVRTALYKQDVRMIVNFFKDGGSTITKLTVRPAKCDDVLSNN